MLELTGQIGMRHHKEFVRRHGMGHMRTLVPRKHWRRPTDGQPYAVDNGKFGADVNGRPWSEDEFLKGLASIPANDPLLFVVCPDVVFGGDESLTFSQEWRQRLEDLGYGWMPWALAVQDGMSPDAVLQELDTGRWSYVFVGGSKDFKRRTLAAWVRLAHMRDLKCHIGGIGRPEDLAWARSCGADSCDYTGWARNDKFQFVTAGRQQQVLITSQRVLDRDLAYEISEQVAARETEGQVKP